MGAGSVKSVQSALPSPEQAAKEHDRAAMQEAVKAKKELVPLAENVAHMFRPELVELRDGLVNRALNRLPPEAREKRRDEFEAYIDIEQILDLYTQTLVDYFTKEELKALRTFMADDTGRKVLEKLPEVLSHMHLKRQQHLQNSLSTLLQEQVMDKVRKGDPSLLAP